MKRTSPYEAEYQRQWDNTRAILSRARRDGVDVSDLEMPSKPKRITAGSVRKITKIHDKILDEVAKRRRIKRYKEKRKAKEKLPDRLPNAAIDNLQYIIDEAITFREEDNPYYEACVNACGGTADDVFKAIKQDAYDEVRSKYHGHSDEWYDIMAHNSIVTKAENLLREGSDTLQKFLWFCDTKTGNGGMPEDDPKPMYLRIIRSMLGKPMSPEEVEALIYGDIDEGTPAENYVYDEE